MKRTFVTLSIFSLIMIFLMGQHLYMMLFLPILLCYLSLQKRYRLFGIVILILVMVSFFYHHASFTSYKDQETHNKMVEIVPYGAHYKIKLDSYKILLKTDGKAVATGRYKISYDKTEFLYQNPNTFSYRRYLYSLGFVDGVKLKDVKLEPIDVSMRRSFKKTFEQSAYDGYYKALLYADKTSLDGDVFKDNGTSHILAISGLHIGLIYGLLYGVGFFIPKRLRRMYALILVLVYVIFIGFPISAVRAWFLIGLAVVANACCRKYDVLQTLGLISLLLMLMNPYILYHSGFQFSFAAVLVIEVVYKALFMKMKSKGLQLLLLPLVIQLGMLPLTVYHQNTLHLLSFLTNIVSVFFIAWVLYGLLIYLLLPMPLILSFVDFIFSMIYGFNVYMDQLDYFKMTCPSPSIILVMIFYIGLALYREKRYLKFMLGIFLIAVVLMMLYYSIVVEVYFFDIGQGDAILIRKGFDTLLIDGGKPSEDKRLRDVLLKQGIGSIDVLMLSHSDMDHMGGFLDIPNMIKNATLLYKKPNDEKEGFDKLKVKKKMPCYSGHLDLGFVNIELLPYLSQDSYNNSSLIGYVTAYETTLFFTGDIESSVEEMLSYKPVDILKVPHHGSKSSSTESMLDASHPEYAIICVGKNFYGHPHKEVLERYEEKQINVLKTMDGCVKVWILPFGIYHVKTLN